MRFGSLAALASLGFAAAAPDLSAPAPMAADPNSGRGMTGANSADAGPGAYGAAGPVGALGGGIGPLTPPVQAPVASAGVNDTLVKNPYAPTFQSATDAAPADSAAKTELEANPGPAVKVYGPAQNFWDKHPASPDLAPLFRYWNPSVRDHFYTADFGVFGSGREGWTYQGIQMYAYTKQVKGTVPLYRYWNTKLLDDYFTVSAQVNKTTGYVLRGVTCYVFPKQVPGSVPLYRYFNQELADHYYTTNYAVMQHGRDGWVLQGIAAYGFPHPHDYVTPGTMSTSGIANYTSKSPDNVPGDLIAPTVYVPPANKGDGKGPKSPPKDLKPDLPAQASRDTPLLVPMYRYWNSVYRDHFYTTLWSELGAGGHNGWEYQGVQALVYANPQPGSAALHRYWNVRTLDHFYSTNFKALGKGKDGWRYEGVAAYIDRSQGQDNVPLYRYFSDSFSDHFYTTRFIGNETRTWVYEGIQGYVHPSWFTDC